MQAHIVISATQTRFAASELEARKVRQEMVDATGTKKSQIVINPVNIPTNKEDLLAFLNARERSHEAVA